MNQHDRNILSTIIERWRFKTSTGHYVDIREMMPRLEDTRKILQLKVPGVAVTVRRVENYEKHIVRMIGQLAPSRNHSFIRLTWLRNAFNQIPENYNRTTLLRYTCAYILYLVGCIIVVDSTYGTIPTIYLQLFEDIDVAGQYAWGAVALVFLFRALSKVVHVDHQHLSGSATLLLCWVYEHFKLLRPIPKEIKAGQPKSLKWAPPSKWYNTHNFNLVG
ncbi:protein MAIN-LIKE 2-like [Amborella trichopoda]|nr:protein MAIN-LIKE 2-like [Amborella trichopoda]|eukprot:XP_020529868.1 protein MAIN-LIKE 2-like [Amborella trichopoda]